MADTEKIIDVLIAIDAESVIQKYGTNTDSDNPQQIATSENFIYMIVRSDEAVSGNGGAELTIAAQTLDVIRWRETSLTLNGTYSTILYEFDSTNSDGLITPPQPIIVEVNTPLPVASDPLHPSTQTINDYFWNCTVTRAGNVTYHFKFMIVDRDNNVQGYYWWDPFIQITD
ncbi:inclusion body family protein [Vreelandella alkaliphila]|uniref:inclusion body family protein n=1 Tax=Vreelandella alkaliphila TaxID=272774 RepID=UPI003FD6F4C6